MKKFFIALSVLAALALSVVPSQALIGMPDDVPGCDLLGFFVVAVDGGLDTALVIQEVGNAPIAGQTAAIHWHIFNVNSLHVADAPEPYTKNDVVPLSMRSLIEANVSPDGLALLLDTTTFGYPVYMGYIRFENTIVGAGGVRFYSNNLIGKMYLHDMAAGQAATVNMAAKEYMPAVIGSGPLNGGIIPAPPAPAEGPWTVPIGPVGVPPTVYTDIPTGFLLSQGVAGTVTTNSGDFFTEWNPNVNPVADAAPKFERFSPDALAASAQMERGYGALAPAFTTPPYPPNSVVAAGFTYYPPVAAATGFALYPRFYLHNETAENYIFVWKDRNAIPVGSTWRVEINAWDEDENPVSVFVVIPDELNVLDVRTILPPSHMAVYPAAGWLSIAIPDVFGGFPTTNGFAGVLNTEFLAYNLQMANSADASLNWSGLFQVARDVNFPRK